MKARGAVLLLSLAAVPAAGQDVGDPCQPGDPAPRPGLSCQASTEWRFDPPEVQNARKGDIVLSIKCGIIAGLLRQVGNRFSHSGIMTRNRSEIRHSTAVEQRIRESAGTDGADPLVLKYPWPGTITRSIDHAYEGALEHGPNGKAYWVQSFNENPDQCEGDVDPIAPVVVMPPPEQESALRSTLEEVANRAGEINGHYRFFGYTNAAIVDPPPPAGSPGEPAPVEAGWAHVEAPLGTVCSQLVWAAARRAGVALEGTTEPGERQRVPGQDGLYLYTEGERKVAAEWLYTTFYDLAYEVAGWGGRLLTDAPDDLASQIANCFGFDWCDTDAKDSERWRKPGTGSAVAPDDLIAWDAPPTGVYGHFEPLAYLPGRFVRLHQWAESAGTGRVVGGVSVGGAPAGGATVRLGGRSTQAAADGAFSLDAVPAGNYLLEASKTLPAGEARGQTDVAVAAGGTARVGLVLTVGQPLPPTPTGQHRLVTVNGTVRIVDHETLGSNEVGAFPVSRSVVLDPLTNRDETFRLSFCAGDEVRVEVDLSVFLEADTLAVRSEAEGRLFEGGACDTSDREDGATDHQVVAADASGNLSIDLRNSDWDGDDTAEVFLKVTNERQAAAAPPRLTVVKRVAPASDGGRFDLKLNGVTVAAGVRNGGSSGAWTVNPGAHHVDETGAAGASLSNYVSFVDGDCDENGVIQLAAGDNKTCEVVNLRKGTRPACMHQCRRQKELCLEGVNDPGSVLTPARCNARAFQCERNCPAH